MIEKLFNHPHLLHQTGEGVLEMPIAAYIDGGGSIILSQEGREIVVNPRAVPELVKLIRTMKELTGESHDRHPPRT